MLIALRSALAITFVAGLLPAQAAEVETLGPANYQTIAPKGKEVDAIYGDFVLRNDWLVAVIAAPGDERDANLTVRNVGGSIIDLTVRDDQSDQLSAFYPGGGTYKFDKQVAWNSEEWGPARGATLAFAGTSQTPAGSPLTLSVGYELRDTESFIRVVSTVTNTGEEPIEFRPTDGARVDGDTFKTGVDHEANLWWAYDQYWGQAYGVQPEADYAEVDRVRSRNGRSAKQIGYWSDRDNEEPQSVGPGESYTWKRRLFPAASNVGLQTLAYKYLGVPCNPVRLYVTDGESPVADATIRVIRTPDNEAPGERISLGVVLTEEDGTALIELPAADYMVRIRAEAHGATTAAFALRDGAPPESRRGFTGKTIFPRGPNRTALRVDLPRCGYAEAMITNGDGQPIPAKVQFIGLGDTPSPNFGPESAVHGVKNLQYTADGTFKCKLLPGEYRWIASYGPEHDAAYGQFAVAAGETATIAASLARVVNTAGYLSSEMHSHSTPSGDNTASQRGRVLNLLAEHLEFCPCTEHQRLDVYDEHLAHFDAQERMLTCPGMELTGSPLPINHQNAFPLKHKPHTQDGGGPQTDENPVKQIERLAGWDDGAEKVVQINHPNFAQMVGDRDLNGEPDAGFEAMYGFTDVIEVDPPELIFQALGAPTDPENGVRSGGAEGRGNEIVNWLQMLNLGYRLTAVVNTDAHYNHHGSGWLRNWVRSSTDDPADASVAELIHEYEHGHVVMSNGPYLMVEATGDTDGPPAIPGDDLSARASGEVVVRAVVRCPNWLEVNRVQLFLNGRPAPEHNYTVRTHADRFQSGPEVFDQRIRVEVQEDTHIVVACGGEGRQLGAVYGEQFGTAMPVAVSNPIYVDTDGDADGDGVDFEPNGDDLGVPLPTPEGLKPSHGHDHPNHHGHAH